MNIDKTWELSKKLFGRIFRVIIRMRFVTGRACCLAPESEEPANPCSAEVERCCHSH